ncbi:MAG: 16S rRNA methyltransferase, partial [Candidatus Latescibacteria bacterium]|nr:16S rRNA methyltransferase [Candidatus Latescibacterota bacterium]
CVCPELIEAIGRHQISLRGSFKQAVKETRNSLHQVAGAYLRGRMRYSRWIEVLKSTSPERLKEQCVSMMSHHASTKERLGELDNFYKRIFEAIPMPGTICDLGCGLNPLARPWMPVPDSMVYSAYDIYTDQADFLNQFFVLTGTSGRAEAIDVGSGLPDAHYDLALLLKFLPLMEHLPHGDPMSLLRRIKADRLVISYPIRSLGGKERGMRDQYERKFRNLLEMEPWEIKRLEIDSELVFLVNK